MKITKLGIILFIFFLVVSMVPPLMGAPGIQTDNATQSSSLGADQSTTTVTAENFRSNFINATVNDVKRNVTVFTDTKLYLEDEFTIEVLDNDTIIDTLNITIPTVYTQYVHSARFFTQLGDDLGLNDANNSKEFSVFRGHNVTTYFIDVREAGFGLNDTNGPLYVKTELIAVHALDITGYSTGQQGSFMSPLKLMLNNLGYQDALIGIGISSALDGFVSTEIERVFNPLGQEMPRFTDTENVITYFNMSRDAFTYQEGLQEEDVTYIEFNNETPLNLDLDTQQLTVVVPTQYQDVERIVTFDPWGTVQVTETITIAHLGGGRNITNNVIQNIHQVPGIIYTLDSDALITDIYDEFGSLEQGTRDDNGNPRTTISQAGDGKQDMQVEFRSAIYGGESYTLTVEYEYNASQVVSRDVETGEYRLNTTLFSDYNTTATNLVTRIQLPAGSTITGHTYQANSRFIDYSIFTNVDRRTLSSFKHIELVISAQNASYTDNVGFSVLFTMNSFAAYTQYVATFMYLAISILALAYVASSVKFNPSKAVEIEKEQIPVDEMDHFFNLFSEKVGAEKRIAELRVKRQRGKLSKKDYDGQVKSIRRRLRDINPQLEKASKVLSAQGGRYENYVKRVMLASQRQSDIRRNAREAKLNYEKGNIPKNIYQLRIKEFNDELKKQEATINKTLTEMVEIIQKYNQ